MTRPLRAKPGQQTPLACCTRRDRPCPCCLRTTAPNFPLRLEMHQFRRKEGAHTWWVGAWQLDEQLQRGAGGRSRGANPWLVPAPGKTVTQSLLQRNPLCQCAKKSATSSQRNPVKSVQPLLHHLGPLSVVSTPTQA